MGSGWIVYQFEDMPFEEVNLVADSDFWSECWDYESTVGSEFSFEGFHFFKYQVNIKLN